MASIATMRMIARIINVFTEFLSVPNIIGIGPMRSTPAPRVFVPEPTDLKASIATATMARMIPIITKPNPIPVRGMSANRSQLEQYPKSFANINSSRIFAISGFENS
jgi:hypothetical protein